MLELQRAELAGKRRDNPGRAHLARILRQQPESRRGDALVSALTQRDFVLPVGLPLQHSARSSTRFSSMAAG
jgi:hypothetical protein